MGRENAEREIKTLSVRCGARGKNGKEEIEKMNDQ